MAGGAYLLVDLVTAARIRGGSGRRDLQQSRDRRPQRQRCDDGLCSCQHRIVGSWNYDII
jgi:hypothetical protein